MVARHRFFAKVRAAIKAQREDQATEPDTIQLLPTTAETCAGIPRPGHAKPNVLCRGCLRWLSRDAGGPRMTPDPIGQLDGSFWCKSRIGG